MLASAAAEPLFCRLCRRQMRHKLIPISKLLNPAQHIGKLREKARTLSARELSRLRRSTITPSARSLRLWFGGDTPTYRSHATAIAARNRSFSVAPAALANRQQLITSPSGRRCKRKPRLQIGKSAILTRRTLLEPARPAKKHRALASQIPPRRIRPEQFPIPSRRLTERAYGWRDLARKAEKPPPAANSESTRCPRSSGDTPPPDSANLPAAKTNGRNGSGSPAAKGRFISGRQEIIQRRSRRWNLDKRIAIGHWHVNVFAADRLRARHQAAYRAGLIATSPRCGRCRPYRRDA